MEISFQPPPGITVVMKRGINTGSMADSGWGVYGIDWVWGDDNKNMKAGKFKPISLARYHVGIFERTKKVSNANLARMRQIAQKKAQNHPTVTSEHMTVNMRSLANSKRAGGDLRPSAATRKVLQQKLIDEFNPGHDHVGCLYCGVKLGVTPHGGKGGKYDSISLDKILTIRNGGKYKIHNLVPACKACNTKRGDEAFLYGHPTHLARIVVRPGKAPREPKYGYGNEQKLANQRRRKAARVVEKALGPDELESGMYVRGKRFNFDDRYTGPDVLSNLDDTDDHEGYLVRVPTPLGSDGLVVNGLQMEPDTLIVIDDPEVDVNAL